MSKPFFSDKRTQFEGAHGQPKDPQQGPEPGFLICQLPHTPIGVSKNPRRTEGSSGGVIHPVVWHLKLCLDWLVGGPARTYMPTPSFPKKVLLYYLGKSCLIPHL